MDEKQPEQDREKFPGAIDFPEPMRLSETVARWLESVNVGKTLDKEAGD